MVETVVVVVLLAAFAIMAVWGLVAEAKQRQREMQDAQRRRERKA
ncbi:MAG TPA: hypothetical protein VK101_11485 [Limnochordia bacterium]|jgi:hypothetical protein|nr:hypothetical protein [Limnochordia bacterium]